MTSLKTGELSNMHAFFDRWGTVIDSIKGSWGTVMDAIMGGWGAVLDSIKDCWRTVMDAIMGGWGAVLDSSCRIVLESQFNSSTIHIRCVLGTLHLASRHI